MGPFYLICYTALIAMATLLYEEKFASGSSLDHNQIGLGASNALTVRVTSTGLQVTSVFPLFRFVSEFYDLEHQISSGDILEVRDGGTVWGQRRLIVRFRRPSRQFSEIELRPRDYKKLKQAVETLLPEKSL
jgi:hypothetical protein